MKNVLTRGLRGFTGLAPLAVVTAVMAQTTVSFDAPGALPAGWTSGITGSGSAKWDVVGDGAARAGAGFLRQSGEATFCWAVAKDAAIRDGFAEVKFRPVSGKEDQAGGLVFRFKDANNYYVVRANALEDNVVLYKTVNGKRSSLSLKGRMFGYGLDADVPQNRWSTLRVDFDGNLFTVSFQGKQLFQVEDDTFKEPGAVGVWTKADSVTDFDDFRFGTKGQP